MRDETGGQGRPGNRKARAPEEGTRASRADEGRRYSAAFPPSEPPPASVRYSSNRCFT